MKLLIAWLLIIGYFLLPAQAQEEPQAIWSTYGIVVNDTTGNTPQENPQIISDGYGGYTIIWEDGRAGFYDVYAQKVDGSGKLLWQKNGVAACNSPGNQNFPKAASDSAGGVIVVWQDYRQGNSDIFAQRITYDGKPVWGKGGIAICTAAAGQFAPEIVLDGFGGAIITWHDYRSGTGEDIYAQRIDSQGKVLWEKDGSPVSVATGTQWYPKIASDGGGGAIIAWTDGRASSSNNDIYAQRISPSGKAYWEKDGIPICSAPHNQEQPVIQQTSNGAIIAWNDSRANNIDIYAQKIALNGQILWEKDGVAVCIYPYPQQNAQLAIDDSGGVIIAWEDQREEKGDIYAQRIYSNGQIAWSENGRPVCRAFGEQKNPVIAKLKNEEWIIVWEDEQIGKRKVDLFAQKVNSAGTPVWDQRGIPIASARESQKSAAVAASPKGDAVVAWGDKRTGNFDIYSQKISSAGTLLWQKDGVLVCAAQGSVVQQNVQLTQNGMDEIILVFEDGRHGYFNIYAQKITKAGILAWGADGIAIANVAANQTEPRVVPDGQGGAYVAWEDHRIDGSPSIRLQRLSSSGKRLWESSLPVAQVNSRQTKPLMISDGAGGAIIAWCDGRDALSLDDIYAQRISSKGNLLWGSKGKIVISANGEQVDADMISDNAGGAILAWTDFRRGDRNPDIYAQRINTQGKVLWQEDGVLVCGAPDVQHTPKVVRDGTGGAIISWTDKGGGSYDIYAQRINKAGKPVWMTDGIPINQLSRTQQNAQFGNSNVLVWEDYRYGNWDIFANAVSPAGKLLWKAEGLPVVSLPHTQYSPQVIPWKNNSVLIVWEDYRTGQFYEIFVQRLDSNGNPIWEENGFKIKSKDGGRAPKIVATPNNDSFYVFWEDYSDGGKAIYGQRYLLY
ncbi:MAG: BNR repeat-containing protein [Candidatus Margulisbacteria bacterium]|nr:BNR repeat-containing protein [Candidatus Margulisiibacteriota bacterium]